MKSKNHKIYSRTGDKGYTTLWKNCLKSKVSKTHPRITTLGAIDELNSILGVAVAFSISKIIKKILTDIQNDLFIIQAEIAGATKKLNSERIKKLEKIIDSYSSKIKFGKFIIPGGTKAGSLLHFSRALCRQTEIEIVKLFKKEKINPAILKYLNRLSNLLYVLARWENRKTKEKSPTY